MSLLSSLRDKRNTHKWWDADCDRVIRNRRSSLSAFKKTKSLRDWLTYKRDAAIARRTIKTKKKVSFDKFCSGIDRFTSLSYVWNTMRIMKNARRNVEWNSWPTKNREDVIRSSIDSLAPPYVGVDPSADLGECRPDEELESPFSRAELDRAMEMIRRDSAPGMDGVEYCMIRALPETAIQCMLDIFNRVWDTGLLPEEWLVYQVVFIDKIGREKIRPISLSSCIGKLMERMINERLIWWAEREDKFSPSQSGFRRGRSCADNLVRIVADIRTALCADEYALAAFLDVSSAYDCVEYRIMLAQLIALNCPPTIARFICNWLYRRKVRFIVNACESIDRYVFRGLPQGAVLSPALYALYTRDLCADLPEGVEAVEFADDIGLYVRGPNRERNRRLLQQAVNILAVRLRNLGLDLEPKKTVLVEFSRSGYIDCHMKIRVGDCDIVNCGAAKFLGVWLDNKLKFDRQVQEIRGKVSRANSIIRYLCGVSKGMEVNTALMLYKSLVRSITDYGSFAFFPREPLLQLKLERAQFLGIRTAMGYRNSTSNNVLIAEAKVRHLRNRAVLLGTNFVNKAIAYNRNSLCDKLRNLLDGENYVRYRQPTYRPSLLSEIWKKSSSHRHLIGPAGKFEIFRETFGAHTFRPMIDLSTGVLRKNEKFSDRSLIDRIKEKHDLSMDPECIFTDGSFSDSSRSTGASIVVCDQEEVYRMSMPKLCSSFSAEAFAVYSALLLLWHQRQWRKNEAVILTDCQAVAKSIYNNHLNVHKNKYITESRILIYNLERYFGKRIVLVWIPAHVGILGNELADGLAKQAAEEEADPSITVPVGDLMAVARRETWEATQSSILRDSQHKGAFYFDLFYDRDATKPWFSKVWAERYFITLINRLRANHYNLGSSLNRKSYIDSARCECGCECEDIHHVILRCRLYDERRAILDSDLREAGFTEEIDVFRLIQTKKWDVLYIIFNFIKSIGKVI
ncbi:uncharacterized protein [Temnothorax nylanderi]|uniref:uncharacterized protein n=1 Tax=Temnothorax nylanderi TaxID=102681 RepID=UPI003A84C3BF